MTTYSILIVDGETMDRTTIPIGLAKPSAAIETARKTAAKYSADQVFVTFFRASDGQRGYLNSDGNHAVAGRAY